MPRCNDLNRNADDVLIHCQAAYQTMIDGRRCPGASAFGAADGMMVTEWIWTGSLYAFARVCRDRLGPNAQAETREVAEGIADAMSAAFPVSWAAIMEN